MKYEVQTTLGVTLEPSETLEEVRQKLGASLTAVVGDYGNVSSFRASLGLRPNELIVEIRFHEGMRAEYVDETATDILEAAFKQFEDLPTRGGHSQMSEESVRLQAVLA